MRLEIFEVDEIVALYPENVYPHGPGAKYTKYSKETVNDRFYGNPPEGFDPTQFRKIIWHAVIYVMSQGPAKLKTLISIG